MLFVLLTGLFLNGCAYPEDITVVVEAPTQATVGEPFELIVKIKNESSEPQTLISIDVGTDYLEGILLEESTPAYVQSWSFDLLGFMSFDYKMEVAPGESLEVVYLMNPFNPGDYSGSVDVCINNEMDCVYNIVRTVVEQADSN